MDVKIKPHVLALTSEIVAFYDGCKIFDSGQHIHSSKPNRFGEAA